ncbi:chymotrypsin-1-like [Copidosoma floridanum]|uniref:chymotrypsin-1-like n=1 Tax=Copidosoma floridanum TaxID=29053 RepID=UPI000C6F721B|nr:chymotrypsin-1-like [Copidosoma floridanum]
MNQKLVVLTYCSVLLVIAKGQSWLGGTPAPDGRYPYQAALRRRSKFLCGASVISRRWLLTAAHCVQRIEVSEDATVAVGTNRVNGSGGVVYKVSQLIVHRNYDKDHVHANDIALVRTASSIKFSKKVRPVLLPNNDSEDHENATVILAGWGSQRKERRPSDYLHHVKLRVVNHARCAKAWRKKRNREITDAQICTSGKLEENVATRGDSGSALVADGVQIGVGSFAFTELPDVFTRVDKYLPWIRRHVWWT